MIFVATKTLFTRIDMAYVSTFTECGRSLEDPPGDRYREQCFDRDVLGQHI